MLGLDVGDKRVGVAMCDPLEMLASIVTVIERKPDGSDIRAICELINKHSVERLVIGLPRLPDGKLGTQAEKTQAFADQLEALSGIPVVMFDERFSTDMAQDMMRQAGQKPEQIRKKKDSAAAALILQWYLDERAAAKDRLANGM